MQLRSLSNGQDKCDDNEDELEEDELSSAL